VDWNGSAITGLDGSVGAPSGYSITHDLARLGVKTEEAADTITNFRKLASKRIPAVATLAVSGDALLGEFPSIEKVKLPLVTKDYFAMVSHQFHGSKPELVERLWKNLAETRDRRAAALYAKYAR
jgi:polar amino acid transport system substrate-binding protein